MAQPEKTTSEHGHGTSLLSQSAGNALWVIIASGTLTVMAGAILGPVVNEIQAGLGVSQSLAGLIITTHGIFIVLASPVAGSLIDRLGPRRPYVVGLVLYGLAGGAGVIIDSFPILLVSRAVLGIGVAFVYTAITVLIYNLFEDQQKDRVMGLRGSANSVGGAIWPLLGGALGTFSWHFPFGVYLLALPLGALALLTVPEPAVTSSERDSEADTDTGGGIRGVAATFFETPLLVLVYGLYFVANVLLYAITIYYPQLLAGFGVDSSFLISLYLAALGVGGGLSSYFYDRLKQRFNYRQFALGALVLWTLGFAMATVASSRIFAIVPVILFGLGQGLIFPTVPLWVEELIPAERQGQFSSYIAMFGYVGQFLSPVLFGLVAGPFGIQAVFASATAVVALLFVLVGIRYLSRTRGRSVV